MSLNHAFKKIIKFMEREITHLRWQLVYTYRFGHQISRKVTVMWEKSNRFRKATVRENCHKLFTSLIYCNFLSIFQQTKGFCLFLNNFCTFKASCVNLEEIHWVKNAVFIFFPLLICIKQYFFTILYYTEWTVVFL